MDDRKGVGILKALSRYKYVILVAVIGILLLIWPVSEKTETTVSVPAVSEGGDSLREQEREMEAILSKVNGVGRVDVMLTLQSGTELVLASNSSLRYSGSPHNPDDYDRSSETVTVSGGSGSDVVVTQEKSPQYRGALVVCDGGDNDAVRLQIIEAVAALTGLGSDRIAVVRWGQESTVSDTIISEEELS